MNQVSVLKSILTIGLWSFLSMPLAFAQEGEGSVLPSNLKLPPQIPSLNIRPIGPKINPNAIDLLAQNGNPVAKKKAAEKLKERQKAKEAEQSDQAQNVAGVNQSEDETTGSSGAAKNNKAIKNKPAKGGKKADADKEDEQWRKVDPKA